MTTQIYPICSIGKGKIAIMPKPDSNNLAQAMDDYSKEGISHIVSLLRAQEVEALQLQQEASFAAEAGIEFISFPIKDMGVPDKKAFEAFMDEHLPIILNGAYYSFHCHGGRGRAGTLAISVMVKSGYKLTDAVNLASEKRSDQVPVCDLQREFLQSL